MHLDNTLELKRHKHSDQSTNAVKFHCISSTFHSTPNHVSVTYTMHKLSCVLTSVGTFKEFAA